MRYFIALLALFAPAWAQSPVNAGQTVQSYNTVGPPGSYNSDTLPLMTDKAFDTDSDSVDFEEGVLNWKGRTFSLGNSRVMRARLERYLASPTVDENAVDYETAINQILDYLRVIDVTYEGKDSSQMQDDMLTAWRLLFPAGQYRLDNGNSLVLANMVHNAWRVKKETRLVNIAGNELQEQKRRMQNKLIQGRFWEEKANQALQEAVAKKRHTGTTIGPALETQFRTEDLAEIKTKVAALDMQKAASAIQLKLEFQSQLVQFLMQRRYKHVIIGASFYRNIFKASHQGLQVGQAQLNEMFPDSDFTPTVDFLEYVAREAMNDAQMGMETVENLYGQNQRYGALERLQETYFLGEYLPEVVQYDADKKFSLLKLYQLTRELPKLMDLKDYGKAETVLKEIEALADDFPGSAIATVINTAIRGSNLAILKAQNAVGTGDFDKADIALAEAANYWPLNPELRKYSQTLASRADMSVQLTLDFDDLYERGDYRSLYKDRAKFAGALALDETRSKKLEKALDKIASVDFSLAQVNEAIKQNSPYIAWEYILNAEEIYAEDIELQKVKAELSLKASNFASTLNKAQEEEENGRPALALNYYLKAKSIHPASQKAHAGLKVNAKKLLEQMASRTTVQQ